MLEKLNVKYNGRSINRIICSNRCIIAYDPALGGSGRCLTRAARCGGWSKAVYITQQVRPRRTVPTSARHALTKHAGCTENASVQPTAVTSRIIVISPRLPLNSSSVTPLTHMASFTKFSIKNIFGPGVPKSHSSCSCSCCWNQFSRVQKSLRLS